jgi:hypothetical protein
LLRANKKETPPRKGGRISQFWKERKRSQGGTG